MVNATTCAKPGPIDPRTGKKTCLVYGAYGYDINEWLVFAQQYFNAMTGCFAVGDAGDSTGVKADPDKSLGRRNRLDTFSDFASFPPKEISPGKQTSGASTITGKIKDINLNEEQTVRWKSVADKVDDGAAYIGLEQIGRAHV